MDKLSPLTQLATLQLPTCFPGRFNTVPDDRFITTPSQWRAEVWSCPGRLLDWMPPYQILVLSSGVWWSLLLDIRCL